MSQKQDKEVLDQLEAIMKELKEARKETATTATIEAKSRSLHLPTFFLNKVKWKLMLVLMSVFIVGILLTVGYFTFIAGERVHTEKGSFIEQMKELSSLATSQAYVKVVIEKEDNQLFGKPINSNLPGTKRKLLLVVPGTVIAGVDLRQVENGNVTTDEEKKTLSIVIPRAELIQEPSLDFDGVQTFSVEGIFREEVNWEEAYELAAEAKEQIRQEALNQGILEIAEKNAEKTLKEFYRQLGYQVTVEFQE
ncbi:DUF4230 domain-containing protein [Cytobacillus spongiae]|uniref:DUF4230 domain-containing protein n=1 Tax=Cytobacillus spongiae TaxID=2901381 RepID=UPI001F206FCA|nr:DUF4230 domain-containing protein [Cytobacillus spongiae]UII55803.1 DUF4230 domain-containing protein [Cytobacillus spongiae]